MPSSVASVAQQVRGGAGPSGERIEMDPQFAAMLGLGLTEGTQVSWVERALSWPAFRV